MTTTIARISPIGYRGDDPTVAALCESIYGPHLATHRKARELIFRLGDVSQDHLTYGQEAGIAPDLLRAVLAEAGVPAREIATDAHLRGALCDWAQIAAPHLHTVWTGHVDLAVGAILALGNGDSEYQRQCLADLDTGAAVGVLALTEAAGTNGGASQQTEARWDPEADGYRLTTPHIGAVKFMPNVADETVPKVVVVTARLIEDDHERAEDRDQGVLAFLVRLRTDEGLVDGVEVVALSTKVGAPMDHGAIRFNDTLVPADGLLTGDWGRRGEDGRFLCKVPPRHRFHRTIRPLQGGRLDLATADIASARAGVAALVNYSRQRDYGDSDDMRRDLATAAAEAYACSVLGHMVRDMSAEEQNLPPLWFMVVKPTLTAAAQQILLTCRERAGAQGHLRCNYLPDWIANVAGAITAEGDNRALLIAAGRAGRALGLLRLDGTPAEQPWWLEMITRREEILGTDLDSALGADEYEPAGTALGRDSAQVDLATTTGVRLTVTAALIAAQSTADPGAAALATSAAAVVALGYLYDHGTWYNAHGLQSPQRAGEIQTDLLRHRRLLAENLTTLAAAFDIPELSGAPIFAPNYLEAVAQRTGWDADSFFPQP